MISFQIPVAPGKSWFSHLCFTEQKTKSQTDEWRLEPDLKTSAQSSSILTEKQI